MTIAIVIILCVTAVVLASLRLAEKVALPEPTAPLSPYADKSDSWLSRRLEMAEREYRGATWTSDEVAALDLVDELNREIRRRAEAPKDIRSGDGGNALVGTPPHQLGGPNIERIAALERVLPEAERVLAKVLAETSTRAGTAEEIAELARVREQTLAVAEAARDEIRREIHRLKSHP